MIKPIAIYLPQYHSIPENDKTWGEGFTEWTNVRKAKPLFEGHYQPHIPHEDVGYYDLQDPKVMVRQAEMAKAYGIHGFAFYHYWFNGKRLLETPLDNMLKTGKPDFPFLYIWANENWTKCWDGQDKEIIIKQEYSFQDDLEHIRFLCKNIFSDKRYITIDEKPVFLVYRTEILPDAKKTALIWRNEAKKFGFKDIYLVRVENFVSDFDPKLIGYDCSMEFAPDVRCLGNVERVFEEEHVIYGNANYKEIVAKMLVKKSKYKSFRCVFPSWDNSARKKKDSLIITEFSTQLFTYFFKEALLYTKANLAENEQLLFINAWNEWGEGCHIEPDKENGYAFLEGIRNSINNKPCIIPNDYFEFIEKNRRELSIQNTQLQIECFKYKKTSTSKDYKVGHLIVNPLRKLRRFFLNRSFK